MDPEVRKELDIINQKLNEILDLLRPVSAHAHFVDDLKQAMYSSRIVKSICGPLSSASDNPDES
tara:strand:+ start:991 stop:1182 length:192 start_codon:yes stop_codon:yes gene_type:complete